MQNDILQSLDQNGIAVLVLLDLSAAFDTIDNETLLYRLEHQFGIDNKSLSWLRSYLTDRYQAVCIDRKNVLTCSYAIQYSSMIGVRAEILHDVHKTSWINLQKYGLRHHFYAYDPQLYICFKPIDNLSKTEILLRVEMCLL